MYVDEIFSGLDYAHFPKITMIENKMKVEEMVCVDDIDLTSTCEHHFVTIDGSAKVAYIPKDTVIGLSKINRLVRFFSQRPQVQERLTQQVLVAMQTLLGTEDVAVTINAVHYCVKSRGVQDGNSRTRTTSLGGVFKSRPLIASRVPELNDRQVHAQSAASNTITLAGSVNGQPARLNDDDLAVRHSGRSRSSAGHTVRIGTARISALQETSGLRVADDLGPLLHMRMVLARHALHHAMW